MSYYISPLRRDTLPWSTLAHPPMRSRIFAVGNGSKQYGADRLHTTVARNPNSRPHSVCDLLTEKSVVVVLTPFDSDDVIVSRAKKKKKKKRA